MTDTANAEFLRAWIRGGCPAIDQNVRFGVNFLKEQATEYGILTIPSQLRTKENILGEDKPLDEQEQSFFFSAVLPAGQDIQQNNANLSFLQSVIDWIWEKNAVKEFPEWNGGRIKSIVPTLADGPYAVSASAAEYRAQIKVTYNRRR